MITAQPEDGTNVRNIIAPPGSGGPTVLRILLGAQLRRLREARGLAIDDAGQVIGASHSKMSRLETGRVGFKDQDIAALLTLYGVTDEQPQGWWHDYSDILPAWFEAYLGLEEAATSIRAYEIQFVPGLLQTNEYARAVTLLGHPAAPADEIERRVRLRMTRQAMFTRPQSPHLWVALDEAVLRRPVGRPGVMRRQLTHLLEAAEWPNVTIQIIPFQAGGHAAAGGPFSILRFAEPDLPDVVYLEQLTSALYLDKRETVDHYMAVMERLCLAAAPASASARAINAVLQER
jgi:transcriptional regulator with XRE-family HTH domain